MRQRTGITSSKALRDTARPRRHERPAWWPSAVTSVALLVTHTAIATDFVIDQPTFIDTNWTISAADTVTILNDGINTHGELTIRNGRVINQGTLTNHGAIKIRSGQTLVNHGLVDNYGNVVIDSGHLENAGELIFHPPGYVLISGDRALTNSGTIDNDSAIRLTYGTIVNDGSMDSSLFLNIDYDGQFSGSGQFNLSNDSLSISYGGQMSVPALVVNADADRFVEIRVTEPASLLDAGTLFRFESNQPLDDFAFHNIYLGPGAQLLADEIFVDRFARLHGDSATAVGHVTVAGEFQVGDSTYYTGGFDVAGDLDILETATVRIGLSGADDGEFTVLDVENVLNLDGTLDVSLLHGYTPAPGDVFTILLAQAITGAFDTIQFPDIAGLHFDFTTTATSGILAVTAEPVPIPPSLALLGSAMWPVSRLARGRHRGSRCQVHMA
ncbi:MAG: hypothetical protein AB7Q81_22875 [Gammaproteobacteria bacterium]